MKYRGKYERQRYLRARRKKATSLYSRSHLPRASLDAHPYFAHAYPAEKEQTLGVVTGTLLGKVRHLCPRMCVGIVSTSTSYMAWAVVILIFEILPFSFRYDLLEFLFAKTYVCNVTAITTILYLPRIRSCIN